MPTVEPSCATHLLDCLEQARLDVVQISSVAASATPADTLTCNLKTSWKRLFVFKLPKLKTRGELAIGFWWQINPHVAYKKLILQGYFLARDHFHICDKVAQGPAEKDGLSAWLHFQACT